MTVGPPEAEGSAHVAQRVGHALGSPVCAFDHGAASPLEDFYDASMVAALQKYRISEEPPMWVIDAPGAGGPQQRPAGDEASGWIGPFLEYVEEQTGAEARWEPFNTKNALHQPPERCWVESASPVGRPAEKLAGLQAFLRLASGGGNTFLDKGHRFALKRYPHAGEPESAESVGGEFYAAENEHIDRLQRCPDLPQPEEGEAKLYGEPTHFTLVVGFDEGTGGTFFPHGRLLPGLGALPDGVSQGARGGILVQSRRGRALLWSNHRGSLGPGGAAMPLLSSLHQSVLRASDDSSREPRRVCIFGWAQEGRKWERSGFHECLEYEPPKVRAEFFGRTMLQELEGWETGHRAGEVKHHLKSAAAQAEIREGFEKGTLSEETLRWLGDYGYNDQSQIFQLRVDTLSEGRFSWAFLTLAGNVRWSFESNDRSMKLEELTNKVRSSYARQVGDMVTRVEVLDTATKAKVADVKLLVQQGDQYLVVVKTMKGAHAPSAATPPSPAAAVAGPTVSSTGPATVGSRPEAVVEVAPWYVSLPLNVVQQVSGAIRGVLGSLCARRYQPQRDDSGGSM